MLVPEKKEFFEGRCGTGGAGAARILVTSPSREPLAPPSDVLEEHLFTDFQEALRRIGAKYAVESIGFEDGGHVGTPPWNERREPVLTVTLYELYLLWRAVTENKRSMGMLCSVFLDLEHSFVVHVDAGTSMNKVLASLPGIHEHLASRDSSLPYDPLTGSIFDPDEDVITHRARVIMFTESGYTLAPAGDGLFPFPYRGKTVHVTEGKPEPAAEKPCNNCLACARFCPAGIHPAYIYHNLIHENLDEAIGLSMKACVRCGICSFVCPSCIPLASTIMETLEREAEE
jgi:Pyruvate/2-oxoacid:ferredoxin oxidoreductase delta subunit